MLDRRQQAPLGNIDGTVPLPDEVYHYVSRCGVRLSMHRSQFMWETSPAPSRASPIRTVASR